MGWRSFALGVIATSAAIVAILVLKPRSKVPMDETITFSNKVFVETNDQVVTFWGTIVRESEFANKNNTATFRCLKDGMRCEEGSAAQIGADQVNEITLEDWEVTDWSPALIAARQEAACSTTTMNVNRRDEAVSFVVIPANLTTPFCSKADAKVHQWSLDTSLFWQRTDPARKGR